jgi:hypothetical protein
MSEKALKKVEYSGPLKFADGLECEAVVLEGGARGFVQSQMMQVLGFRAKNPGTQFRRFLAETSPNALILMDEKGYEVPVKMPSGQTANFTPYEVIPEIVSGVIRAALTGTLHTQRRNLVEPCLKIQEALTKVGIVALIDEATGYQYHRAPDALQDLFARLIRKDAREWDRRFPDEYYRAVLRLWGKEYTGNAGGLPAVVGKVTRKWVYEQVLPTDLLAKLDAIKETRKKHEHLTDEGLALLGRQIVKLTTIAETSYSYQDFDHRCHVMFDGGPQQTGLRLQ